MRSHARPHRGRALDAEAAPTDPTVRLLVVEDHELVRFAIRTLLAGEPGFEIVDEVATVAAARDALAVHRPDIVVLDVHLPDGDGLELCPVATENGTAALVLTAYAGETLIGEAMQAGASGYVLKHDPASEILTALHNVAVGGAHFSGGATPQMMAMIASGGMPEDPLAHLSTRERELLGLLGEGLSNRQIAERLYLGERTVKNYVSRLLRKLELDRRAEAAAYAAKLDSERQLRRFAMVPG